MRLGVAKDAGLVFGQVKARKGCVGGGFWGRGSGIGKVAGEIRAVVRRSGVAVVRDGAQARSCAAGRSGPGPGAGLEPVTFERLPGEPGG
jgi:hypothetical protein